MDRERALAIGLVRLVRKAGGGMGKGSRIFGCRVGRERKERSESGAARVDGFMNPSC